MYFKNNLLNMVSQIVIASGYLSKMKNSIPETDFTSLIYEIRGYKVMLDSDLARLYGVETRRLKEQVRRNIDRFPGDFMFVLNNGEDPDMLIWYSRNKELLCYPVF